ncbi:hypothetical protein CR513_39501, partial [Mucuna pruriens]
RSRPVITSTLTTPKSATINNGSMIEKVYRHTIINALFNELFNVCYIYKELKKIYDFITLKYIAKDIDSTNTQILLSKHIIRIIIEDTNQKNCLATREKYLAAKKIWCMINRPKKGTIIDLITIRQTEIKIKIIISFVLVTLPLRRGFVMFTKNWVVMHLSPCIKWQKNENPLKPKILELPNTFVSEEMFLPPTMLWGWRRQIYFNDPKIATVLKI